MNPQLIRSGTASYSLGKKVAENERYRAYSCSQEDTQRDCLLLIPTATEHNGSLDRWAYTLRELTHKSEEIEAEYAQIKSNPNRLLNYDLGFPHVIDSFIPHDQGGRRIIILGFRNIANLSTLVPLENLMSKDRLRVDLRTSVWIIGKLLKLLAFAHSEGFAVRLLNANNVLIQPDNHYVLIFDWSSATMTEPGKVPVPDQRTDIIGSAQIVLRCLGCNLATGQTPDADDASQPYVSYLLTLARGAESNAETAHSQLYRVTDSIWQREFYPFTTKLL